MQEEGKDGVRIYQLRRKVIQEIDDAKPVHVEGARQLVSDGGVIGSDWFRERDSEKVGRVDAETESVRHRREVNIERAECRKAAYRDGHCRGESESDGESKSGAGKRGMWGERAGSRGGLNREGERVRSWHSDRDNGSVGDKKGMQEHCVRTWEGADPAGEWLRDWKTDQSEESVRQESARSSKAEVLECLDVDRLEESWESEGGQGESSCTDSLVALDAVSVDDLINPLGPAPSRHL